MDSGKELERIREVYNRRKATTPSMLYSYFNVSNLFMVQSRERALLAVLKAHQMQDLREMKILDVGCGTGGMLRSFLQYGALPSNLSGVDLLEERILEARSMNSRIDFRVGEASRLPYRENCFDVVSQFTVFTSILDAERKRLAAREMLRVVKPDGVIVWYDFHVNNPANQEVAGVKKSELFALFPGCRIVLKRITLAPPIVRLVAPYSWTLCVVLERLNLLNTHYLAGIRKPQG